MGVRISDSYPNGHKGIRLEINGCEVQELVSVKVDCGEYGTVPQITAVTLATSPLVVDFDMAHVTIIRNDLIAQDIIRSLLNGEYGAQNRATQFIKETR